MFIVILFVLSKVFKLVSKLEKVYDVVDVIVEKFNVLIVDDN